MEIRICSLCPGTRKQPRRVRFYAPLDRWFCQVCYRGLTKLGLCDLCKKPRPLVRQRKTGVQRCEGCRHGNRRKLLPVPQGTCPGCTRPDLRLPHKSSKGIAVGNRCYRIENPVVHKMGICPICLPKHPKPLYRRLADGRLVCDSCGKWAARKKNCTECQKPKKALRRFKRQKGKKGRLVCQPCLRRLDPPKLITCIDCGQKKPPKSTVRCGGCATRHWRRTHPSA